MKKTSKPANDKMFNYGKRRMVLRAETLRALTEAELSGQHIVGATTSVCTSSMPTTTTNTTK